MFKVTAPSTFFAKVRIAQPGAPAEEVTFEFRHMRKGEFDLFLHGSAAKDRSDFDTVAAIVCGWQDVDAAFSAEALKQLLDNYQGAAINIVRTWVRELTGVDLNQPAAAGNN